MFHCLCARDVHATYNTQVFQAKALGVAAILSTSIFVTIHQALPRLNAQRGRGSVTVDTPTFVDHPRLFLTKSKKATLIAKKAANDQDYVTLKAYADQVISQNPWF